MSLKRLFYRLIGGCLLNHQWRLLKADEGEVSHICERCGKRTARKR